MVGLARRSRMLRRRFESHSRQQHLSRPPCAERLLTNVFAMVIKVSTIDQLSTYERSSDSLQSHEDSSSRYCRPKPVMPGLNEAAFAGTSSP